MVADIKSEQAKLKVVLGWLKQNKAKRRSKKELEAIVGASLLRRALRSRGACRRSSRRLHLTEQLRSTAKKYAKSRAHGAYHKAYVATQNLKKRLGGYSRASCYAKLKGIKEALATKRSEKREKEGAAAMTTLERIVVFTPTFFIENEKVKTVHTDVLFTKLLRKRIA